MVTGAVAVVAGADPRRAAALGLAMFAFQVSIGALNDLIDRPADAVAKPHKPLVAGLVSASTARAIVAGGLVTGLVVSALHGVGVLALGVIGAGIGYLYDLRLSRTSWAWLAFAVAVPLLPVYAWLGAGATVPQAFAILVPAAMAAGAALALGNQLADVAADALSGVGSMARRLGPARTWTVMTLLYGGVGAVAIASLVAFGGRGPALAVAGTGVALLAAGVGAARAGGRRGPSHLAWELQATGVGVLAAGWLWALGEVGALAD